MSLTGLTGTARADNPKNATSASDPASAKEKERTALFRDGTALADKGDWQGAVDKFRAVIAIRSAPKALLALGIAEEQLGRLVRAKAAFAKAASDAHEARLFDDEQKAVSSLALLMPRIPRLVLQIPPGTTVARASVDGADVTVPNEGLEVDPGTHYILAERFQKTVHVEEKQRLEVVLDPQRSPEPPAPTPTPTPAPAAAAPAPAEPSIAPHASRPIAALAVGGGGLVLGAAGALFLALGKGQESDAKALCPGGGTTGCPSSARSDAEGSRTKILVGDVLLGVGAAAVITGGIWWLASGKSAPADPKTGIVVAPNGVGYRGVF
ncbi:tol-pal system YbgF family protein [Pendulispora albinea]|uniref:PEGA domain-containing protein n=1 Tax=Pendulispora albinea TaxID=2741071 RepID=A0ABZ2MBY8_9BACT